MSTPHEGNRIKELLTARGHSISDLARACHISQPGAQKYVGAETLGAKAWETCRVGLEALGIDPRLVRPLAATLMRVKERDRERGVGLDIRDYVTGFTDRQLGQVKTILETDPASQMRLLAYIEGRLDRGR